MVVGRLLAALRAPRCATRLGGLDAGASTCRRHGRSVISERYEQPPGSLGRRALPRRRLRQLRLGLQRGRGRGRSRHLARCAAARHRGRGDRQGDPPAAGRRPDRRRHAQGLGCALLEEVVMRDGRMANAQLTNYIIPTTLDTPTIDVGDPREAVPARPVRRQGRGRDADRRPGARGRQRAPPRRLRRARDPGDAGADPGGRPRGGPAAGRDAETADGMRSPAARRWCASR